MAFLPNMNYPLKIYFNIDTEADFFERGNCILWKKWIFASSKMSIFPFYFLGMELFFLLLMRAVPSVKILLPAGFIF